MEPGMTQRRSRPLRTMAVIFASVFVVGSLFRLTTAGDLAPTSAPANNSMTASGSLDVLYEAMVSSSYDSSWIQPDEDGNAFEVTKCIIEKMTGGVCI